MAFSKEKKRELRAQNAKAEGRRYRPRVKTFQTLPLKARKVEILPEPVPIELDLERSRVESEDFRGHLWRLSTTGVIVNNPLYVGRDVRLKPVAMKMMGIKGDNKFYLVRKHNNDCWVIAKREGVHKGKELYCEIPEDLFW